MIKFGGIWSTLSTGPYILGPQWSTLMYYSLQTLSSKTFNKKHTMCVCLPVKEN